MERARAGSPSRREMRGNARVERPISGVTFGRGLASSGARTDGQAGHRWWGGRNVRAGRRPVGAGRNGDASGPDRPSGSEPAPYLGTRRSLSRSPGAAFFFFFFFLWIRDVPVPRHWSSNWRRRFAEDSARLEAEILANLRGLLNGT